MLRLNCFIKVTGDRAQVLDAAKRLTVASLKQDGCIAYDIFESATRPDVMMICETWRDKEALEAHSKSDVFVKEVAVMETGASLKLETFSF